jgi:hypothetical protein
MPKSVDTNKNDDYGDNMVEITNYQNRKEITMAKQCRSFVGVYRHKYLVLKIKFA